MIGGSVKAALAPAVLATPDADRIKILGDLSSSQECEQLDVDARRIKAEVAAAGIEPYSMRMALLQARAAETAAQVSKNALATCAELWMRFKATGIVRMK